MLTLSKTTWYTQFYGEDWTLDLLSQVYFLSFSLYIYAHANGFAHKQIPYDS